MAKCGEASSGTARNTEVGSGEMVHGEASSGVARHGTPGSAVWGMVELGVAYARWGVDS